MYYLENELCGKKGPDYGTGSNRILDICSAGLHSDLAQHILR